MDMTRPITKWPAVSGAVLAGLLCGPHVHAQSQAVFSKTPSGPEFEVASVKPAPARQAILDAGSTPHIGIKIDGARVDIGNWSVKQLILRAYGIEPHQLLGPDWMDSFRFDVLAKLPQGAAQAQVPQMLQWLLVERFGLAAHTENKEMSGFALVVPSGGLKMKPAAPELDDSSGLAANTLDELWGAGKPFGLTTTSSTNGNLHMEFTKMPMPALVQILASYLRAPVIDLTGLKGKYQASLDFSLTATIAATGPGTSPVASDPGDTSLFSTVNRLGLRLERRKVPAGVLVVDHVEQVPTAN